MTRRYTNLRLPLPLARPPIDCLHGLKTARRFSFSFFLNYPFSSVRAVD